MSHSTRQSRRKKPAKPYPGFPLFAHATGRWAKKIRGRLHYFGKWNDPEGALQKYLDQRGDLHAGRTPRVRGEGLTVRELCNRFLTGKQSRLQSGELVQRTFDDYHRTCKRLVDIFGQDRLLEDLAADDFEILRADIASTFGPAALSAEITRVRVIMKYAYDQALIASPVRYGQSFDRPPKRLMREHRNSVGERMFEPRELQAILDAARQPMKTMVLMGVNCAFGPADLGRLVFSALDLDAGWVTYPRPKTGIRRRCPLWPETVSSLGEAAAQRPKPKDEIHAGLVFITRDGRQWADGSPKNKITEAFRYLLKKLGLYRNGLGFYSLRRSFRAVSDEVRDFPAIDLVMGHRRNDMASVYRERISDERLRAVTDHVHKWLFAE